MFVTERKFLVVVTADTHSCLSACREGGETKMRGEWLAIYGGRLG